MQDFAYVAAHTVAEAVSLLSQDGDGTRVLSGGTDLLVQLREGRRRAGLLVDIKTVPEANALGFDPASGLTIGAAVPCYRLCDDSTLQTLYPGLLDAVSLIGGTQIQGRATLGGNLCNASPAADSIPALIVHRATCVIAGPEGRRKLPVEQFCIGPGRNALAHGELLLALQLPPPAPGSGSAYLRFIPRNEMDIAVVGAGATVELADDGDTIRAASVALGAVAPTPLPVPEVGDYLTGRKVSAEALAEGARIARGAARPINDMRGTVSQRTHLSGVLARRALERAITRAREGQRVA